MLLLLLEVDLEKELHSKLGDLYMLGSHRLLCGDSIKVEDVIKVMLTDKADLVFTDPPWNVNYGGVKEDNPQGYKPRTISNDFMGTEDFKKFMFDVFSRMAEFSKKGCPTYVVMLGKYDINFSSEQLRLVINDCLE